MDWEALVGMWAVVCPLVFLGGIVDAVAGGGGLITVPAYLLAGLDPHAATATNKCGNLLGMAASAARFLRGGNVHIPGAVWGGLGSVLGAWAGSRLNLVVPDRALYYVMLVLVPVMAAFLLLKRDFGQEDRSHTLSPARIKLLSLLAGLLIGGYDGFFGPGAGTFLILVNTGLCRFGLLTASGNAKIANVASCVASLATYALAGEVQWAVGLPAALCGMAGGYVGAGLALKNGAKIIRPMFFVVLALLLLRLLSDLSSFS